MLIIIIHFVNKKNTCFRSKPPGNEATNGCALIIDILTRFR